MDRSLWLQSLSKTYCPPWPCSVCGKGNVALVRNSLVKHETVESKTAHDHEAWDPDWIMYGFTAWAECQHPTCKQKFSICGTGGVGAEQDEEGNVEWGDYFDPQHCFPTLRLIKVPEKCPDDIKAELDAAFALYWSHPAASAGRIRVALELLLNHQGVPKRKRSGRGKCQELWLHARLDLFAKANPTTGSQLMALKSLGNTGAHEGSITKSDLLDAFEVLEHSLDEIIDQRSKRVAALAKSLTKKHGKKS